MSIKKRLFLLRAIDERMATQIAPDSGNQVRVWNWDIYDIFRDVYAMLVIDLNSYCEHFIENGGFLRQLNNHLSRFCPTAPKKIKVPLPQLFGFWGSHDELKRMQTDSRVYYQQRLSESQEESLTALFPNWKTTKKVSQKDVEDLKGRFKKIYSNLDNDRNKHRAHKYENVSRKAHGTKAISVQEIEAVFKEIQEILGHLFMIDNLSSTDFEINYGHGGDTAKDLVELMIMGSIDTAFTELNIADDLEKVNGVQKCRYWQYREGYIPIL